MSSEDGRPPLRADMEHDAEQRFVFRELQQSAQEGAEGRTWSAEDVDNRSRAYLEELDHVDRRWRRTPRIV